MTEGCVDPAMFLLEDGVLIPHEHLQWRHVATAKVEGVAQNWPRSNTAQRSRLSICQAAWTNTTAITQNVYALVSRGGSSIELGPANRAAIEQHWGWAVGAADIPPADPAVGLSSRFGGGIDTGTAGGLGYLDYSIYNDRIGPRTAFLGPTLSVVTNATIKARCEIWFVSDYWTAANVDGGATEGAENNYIVSGETRVDLYSYPELF